MIFAVTAVFIVILLVGGLRFGALKRELLARQRIVETSVNDELSASDEALTQLLLAFDKLRAGVVVVDGDGDLLLEGDAVGLSLGEDLAVRSTVELC